MKLNEYINVTLISLLYAVYNTQIHINDFVGQTIKRFEKP